MSRSYIVLEVDEERREINKVGESIKVWRVTITYKDKDILDEVVIVNEREEEDVEYVAGVYDKLKERDLKPSDVFIEKKMLLYLERYGSMPTEDVFTD